MFVKLITLFDPIIQISQAATLDAMQKQPKFKEKSLEEVNKQRQRYQFYFSLNDNEPAVKIEIFIEPKTITEQVILSAISKVNVQLAPRGYYLSEDISLYKPRLVGKNFKPKTDMPCLDIYQKICDLNVTQMAIQIVNKEKAIKLIEKPPIVNNTVVKETENNEIVNQAKNQLQKLSLKDTAQKE